MKAPLWHFISWLSRTLSQSAELSPAATYQTLTAPLSSVM